VSLLDSGNQTVTVFLEETFTDPDGNVLTRPSKSGVRARARIQPVNSTEDNAQGFDTTGTYTLRFPRSFRHKLGAQSQLDWLGERWVVYGEVARYTNSPATAHDTYVIKRK
jgi:hypothetical protein